VDRESEGESLEIREKRKRVSSINEERGHLYEIDIFKQGTGRPRTSQNEGESHAMTSFLKGVRDKVKRRNMLLT